MLTFTPELLGELWDVHPGNLTPGMLTQLRAIRTDNPDADRIVARREKWEYDHKSTMTALNPLTPRDLMAALAFLKAGRWPETSRHRRPATGRARLFSPEFVTLVDRASFEEALGLMRVGASQKYALLDAITGAWGDDGHFRFTVPDGKVDEAVALLATELWAILRTKEEHHA